MFKNEKVVAEKIWDTMEVKILDDPSEGGYLLQLNFKVYLKVVQKTTPKNLHIK